METFDKGFKYPGSIGGWLSLDGNK